MKTVICKEHGLETEKSCSWCAKKICLLCITEAKGHRLCNSCVTKLSSEKPLIKRRKILSQIKNVDITLSEDMINEAKEQILPKKKKEPKIRNIPDEWPSLVE